MNIYLKTADKIIRNKYVITLIVIILLYQLTDTEGFRGKMHMLRQKHRKQQHLPARGKPHKPANRIPSNRIPSNGIPSNRIPSNRIIIHTHAHADHNTDHNRMSGARIPASFIPIDPLWSQQHRRPTTVPLTYSGRNVNNSRWQDYLSFSWVPRLLGICKRGCTYLGKGQHGCTHPGGTVGDCQFASDCRWC